MGWSRGCYHGSPRGVCCGEWSGVRCHDSPGSGGTAQDPLQEVKQNYGHYCGLPGSDGAAQNLLQEVEQSRGRYCGLPGGPGLDWSLISVEVRTEIIC